MSTNVSDRLRDALERLDQAIDQLDARLTTHLESVAERPSDAAPNPAIAERLDRIIRRIEMALAE